MPSQFSGQAPPATLAWLADAPLFIDSDQVSAFYDAVVRPEGRMGKLTLSLTKLEGQKTNLGAEVGGEVSVSSWIKTLLPFLDVKLNAKGSVGRETSSSSQSGETIDLYPIETPHRQLIQLALHYLVNFPKRTRLVTNPLDTSWRAPDFVGGLPRALVFVDFPPGTKFIPMAAEVDKGHVVLMFEKLDTDTEKPPKAPMLRPRANDEASKASKAAWVEYWNWFGGDRFDALAAMRVVEQTVGEGGLIQWIDYRVPLEESELPLHLSVVGRGRYSTGVFAFQTIARGYEHGLRMVCTLKSEPAMNVLAIFEK